MVKVQAGLSRANIPRAENRRHVQEGRKEQQQFVSVYKSVHFDNILAGSIVLIPTTNISEINGK